MSGIGAIFHRDGSPVPRPALERMAAGLLMYGRDGQFVTTLGPVGMVYSHLGGFTPEDAHEAQPLAVAEGTLLGVFDGRIDNRDDLLPALGLGAAATAGTTPDSLVFLRAWQAWGPRAAARVIGSWAAVLWDARAGTLHAARDPLGGRSLHAHVRADRVVVASAPKAIHALGDVPRRYDEQKVADGLILNYMDSERGWFQGIRRIGPGVHVAYERDRERSRRTRDPGEAPPVRLGSDEEYVEGLRDVFTVAVRAALRTAAPPAAHLSGGLDSTTVVATALPLLRERGETLHAFTSVPLERWRPHPEARRVGDESPNVRAFLARYPDLRHTFVRAEDRGLTSYLGPLVEAYEAPPRNAMNLHWIHEIDRLAREAGSRVVLTGAAGNLTLSWSGETWAVSLLRQRRLRALARGLWREPDQRVRGASSLVNDVGLRLAPPRATGAYARLRGRPAHGWAEHSAIAPAFAAEADVDARARAAGFDPTYSPIASKRDFLRATLHGAGAERADLQQAFRAVHGVETRDPTFDLRVLEWCMGVPDEQFRRPGTKRWMIKRLMADHLPPEVLDDSVRGRQAADARLRIGDELDHIRAELDDAARDPELARLVDIGRLRRATDDRDRWTRDQDPPGLRPTFDVLALSRAVAALDFVRWARTSPQAASVGAVEQVDLVIRAVEQVPVALERARERSLDEG